MINGFELFFESTSTRLPAARSSSSWRTDEASRHRDHQARGLVEGQACTCSRDAERGRGLRGLALHRVQEDSRDLPDRLADDLTQRKRNPYLVRTGGRRASPRTPSASGWSTTSSTKKVRDDRLRLRLRLGGSRPAFSARSRSRRAGVQKLWPPLGTADFAPYLSQLRRDVDAIYAVFSGADALRFASSSPRPGSRKSCR